MIPRYHYTTSVTLNREGTIIQTTVQNYSNQSKGKGKGKSQAVNRESITEFIEWLEKQGQSIVFMPPFFYIYEKNHWKRIDERALKKLIWDYQVLQDQADSLKAIRKIIEYQEMQVLEESGYFEPNSNLIFFQDRVYDIVERKYISHSKEQRNQYVQPFNSQDIGAITNLDQQPKTRDWLNMVTGHNELKRQLLIDYLYLILVGETKFHIFLELTGPGKSGKSTQMMMAEELVGETNVMSTTLRDLESRFESGPLMGKKQIVLPDQRVWTGATDMIKKITGQDTIRYELKFQDVQTGFKVSGLVLLTANKPVFKLDEPGMSRRRIPVVLNNVNPNYNELALGRKGHQLIGELAPELPLLLSYLLSQNGQEIADRFEHWREVYKDILDEYQSVYSGEASSIAEYIEENLMQYGPGHIPLTQPPYIEVRENLTFSCSIFAQYKDWCRSKGYIPLDSNQFSNTLRDYLIYQLHWDVQKIRTSRGRYFKGLAVKIDHPNLTQENLFFSFRNTVFDKPDSVQLISEKGEVLFWKDINL